MLLQMVKIHGMRANTDYKSLIGYRLLPHVLGSVLPHPFLVFFMFVCSTDLQHKGIQRKPEIRIIALWRQIISRATAPFFAHVVGIKCDYLPRFPSSPLRV